MHLLSVSTVVGLALTCAASAQTVRAFGVDNDPIGEAVLERIDEDLLVTNAAGLAEYGSTFEVGPVKSASVSYHVETDTPPDTFVETRFLHMAGTNTIRMQRAEHGYAVHTEFNGVDAETFTLEAFLDGELIEEVAGLTDGDVIISSDEEWSIFCWTIKCTWCSIHQCNEYGWVKVEDEAVAPTRTITVLGNEIEADALIMRPDGDGSAGPLERIETVAHGIESFQVTAQGRGYADQEIESPVGHLTRGLTHIGVGDVEIDGLDGGSVCEIRNLGATGLDGVDVTLPGAVLSWKAEFGAIDPTIDDGSALTLRAMAMVNGAIDQEAARLSATKDGMDVLLQAGFYGEIDPALQQVEVRLGGELVATVDASSVLVLDAWPSAASFENTGCDGECAETGNPICKFDFTNVVFLLLAGQLYEGDEVVFKPLDVDTPAETSIMTRVKIEGNGLGELVIEDQQVQRAGGCAADINADGALDILDFVAFQAIFQAGDMTADLNNDGVLSILDFIAFQGMFLAGC